MQRFKFNCLDHDKSKYLSCCDLLNKFIFKGTKLFPELEKIVLTLSLKDLMLSSDVSLKSKEIKSLLFFTLFISINPHISFKSTENKLNAGLFREQNGEYSLKVVLSRGTEIQQFLFYFFCEHHSLLKKEGLLYFPEKKVGEKTISHSLFAPLSLFSSFLDTFNSVLTHVNVKESFLYINFVLSRKSKQEINFKNLPFFWMND